MQTACRVRLALVCCLAWGKSAGLKNRPTTKVRKKNTPGFPEGPGRQKTREPGAYTDEHIMALENCKTLQGNGMEAGAAGETARRANVAVACDLRDWRRRASRVDGTRAEFRSVYEHCDFESYVTDLTDGKTWTPQHAHSLKQAKLFTQGFVREYPGSSEKGLLFMGPSGVGKNTSCGCGIERI